MTAPIRFGDHGREWTTLASGYDETQPMLDFHHVFGFITRNLAHAKAFAGPMRCPRAPGFIRSQSNKVCFFNGLMKAAPQGAGKMEKCTLLSRQAASSIALPPMTKF
jgi:hypothetical protein